MQVKTTLQATPSSYDGIAPAVIKFQGAIDVTEATEDCVIQYHFLRSDGGRDRNIRRLEVKKPGGTFPISTQWKLSPPNYAGWEAVEIVAPEHVVSNHATFSVKCHRIDLAVNTFYVQIGDFGVKFAAGIANVGDVDFRGPFKIIIGAGPEHGITVQSTIEVPSETVISAGSTFVSKYAAQQPLEYTEYWVDIILDPDRQLQEMNRRNDRLQAKWIWAPPA